MIVVITCFSKTKKKGAEGDVAVKVQMHVMKNESKLAITCHRVKVHNMSHNLQHMTMTQIVIGAR